MKKILNLLKQTFALNSLGAIFNNDESNIVSGRGWLVLSRMCDHSSSVDISSYYHTLNHSAHKCKCKNCGYEWNEFR